MGQVKGKGSGAGGFSSKRELYAIAPPTDKPAIEVWHTTTLGFGARIMRKNSRTGEARRVYLARYRVPLPVQAPAEGELPTKLQYRDVRQVLAEFGSIDYDTAHAQAIEIRSAERRSTTGAQKPLPALGEALEEYIEERGNRLSDSTKDGYRYKWKKYLGPWLETSVLATDSDWWQERYLEIAKHGRPTATAVVAIAHAIYESLVDDERLVRNPVRRVAAKQQVYAHREPRQTLIKRRDLPVVWAWLEAHAHPSVRDMFRIALMTGMRDAVVGALRWENIDIEQKLLMVPAEERGNKAKRLVAVPVSDWLHANVVLPRWKARRMGEQWLIPSPKRVGAPLRDIRGSMSTLHTETGIHVGPHLLRRTFATLANRATGDRAMTARMLTHSIRTNAADGIPAVTGGYIVTEDDELRAAFNKTAALIVELATTAEGGQSV